MDMWTTKQKGHFLEVSRKVSFYAVWRFCVIAAQMRKILIKQMEKIINLPSMFRVFRGD